MAWVTKYRIYIPDKDENRQATIDIQKDGYGGGITELIGNNECKPSTPGGDELLNLISGKELKFGFHATAAETSTYDEFLTEDPGTMKVIFKPDGTNIEFVGFIQPGNATRIMAPMVQYRMVATDGLANLKDIDYLDTDGTVFEDTTSKLTVIKRCLQLIGIDECDIFTQVNTYEASEMTSSEDPINEVDCDNRRFYSNRDGEERAMKAHDVLEEILTPLNARIFQEEGYWKIVNDQEPNSYRVIYDYATLAVDTARAANNRIVDISNKVNYPEYSFTTLGKIQPIKKLRVKFLNKNLGNPEISNGDFQLGTTSGHNNDNWDQFTVGLEGSNYYLITTDNTGTTTIRHFYSDSFNISTFEVGDKLKIAYKVRLNGITFSGSPPPGQGYPSFYVGIQKDGGPIQELYRHYLQETGTEWQSFIDYYTLPGTGSYVIHFYVEPNEAITYMRYEWDDLFYAQQRETDIVTFDKVYIFENSAAAYREEEIEILFGDSLQNSDVGALKVAGTNTDLWSRYSKGESSSLIELLGQQIINNYQSIKDFRNIRIDDPNNNIVYGTILQIDSEKFVFKSYEKDYRMNVIKGRIEELLTSDATVVTSIQPLTSIDGEKSSSSGEITVTVPSYWSQAAAGIYTVNNVGIGMAPTGSYGLEVADDGYIGGDLDVDGNLDVTGTGHDSFSDYVADEHIDHTTVSVLAGAGLSGGGTIAATRTIDLDLSDLMAVTSLIDSDVFGTYIDGVGQRKITYQYLKSELNSDLDFSSSYWLQNGDFTLDADVQVTIPVGNELYFGNTVQTNVEGVGFRIRREKAGTDIFTFEYMATDGTNNAYSSLLGHTQAGADSYFSMQVKQGSEEATTLNLYGDGQYKARISYDMEETSGTQYGLYLNHIDAQAGTAISEGLFINVEDSTRSSSGEANAIHVYNSGTAFKVNTDGDMLAKTINLSSNPSDTTFSTSQIAVRDSLGNLEFLAASGGGTSNYLRADGTWAEPPGGGGGDVSVSGTPADNQIARWTDATHIEGTADLTFAAGVLYINGNIEIENQGAGANPIFSSNAAGTLLSLASALDVNGTLYCDYFVIETTPGDPADFGNANLLVRDTDGTIDKVGNSSVYSDDYYLNADGNWTVPGPLISSYLSVTTSTWAFNAGGAKSIVKAISTNSTTSEWTISQVGFEVLFPVYMTGSTDKILTIKITGERLIVVGSKVAASAATESVVLTIPGGANYQYELLITKTGHTYSGDDIYHVSLIEC